MNYILVLYIYASSNLAHTGGPAVTAIELNSLPACKQAFQQIKTMDMEQKDSMSGLCIPKGAK